MILKEEKKEVVSVQGTRKYKTLIIFVSAVFLLMFVVVGSAAYYYYNQYKKALKNSAVTSKSELQIITDTIGRYMNLPESEEPTLATVTDVEKIKDQPFFTRAQNGDKVLIYSKSGKAILYRPLTGKIIEVSAVSGTKNEVSSTSAEAPVQNSETISLPAENNQTNAAAPAKVVVYNGARIDGLEQKIADQASQVTGIEILEKANAKGIYKNTLVIDLSGRYGELVQKIAETIGGAVGKIPEWELKPVADVLIIGGSNFQR